MAHQIQRYSAPSEARFWGASSDRYRTGRSRENRQASSPQRVTAKAATFDSEVRQSGTFQVTTDDGDKVSISLSALSKLHAESFQGEAGGASIDYASAKSSSKSSVSVEVKGSLDDEELADITKLLGQLAASVHDSGQSVSADQLQDGGEFESLSSFQFAYRERIKASYSESEVATGPSQQPALAWA